MCSILCNPGHLYQCPLFCWATGMSVSYWFRYNKEVFIHFYILVSNYTIIALPSTTWEYVVYKPLVSAAKRNALCLIINSSQVHISSFQFAQQHLSLQFWFSSTAAPQPALPLCIQLCFLGNHCQTTSQKPAMRSNSLLPSIPPWSSMSQVTDFSSKGKTLCKGSGFGLLSVWMLFPFNCSVLLGMMNDPYLPYLRIISLRKTNRSSNKFSRVLESLFKSRIGFPGKSLLARKRHLRHSTYKDRPYFLQFDF